MNSIVDVLMPRCKVCLNGLTIYVLWCGVEEDDDDEHSSNAHCSGFETNE